MIYRKFIASLLTITLLVGVFATPVTASASSRVADTTPPIVTYPSENQTFRIRMGEPFIMDILASHSEERTLTYNLSSFPSSLRLDPHSGRVTWTPDDPVYLRKNEVTFYVEEDRFGYTRGRAVYHTFFIEVLDEQQEPVSTEQLTQPGPAMVQPSTNQPSTDPSPGPILGVTAEETVTELPSSIEEDTRAIERLLREIAQEVERAKRNQTLGSAGFDSEPAIPGIPDHFWFSRDLELWQSSEDVRYLQILLNRHSDTQVAISGVGSPGNETDYFGTLTWRAVHRFQRKYADEILVPRGLYPTESTGYFGSTSRIKANDILRKAREANDQVPDTPLVLEPLEEFITPDTTTFSGEGTPGSTVFVERDGYNVGETTVAKDGTWSISDVPVELGPNTYVVWARKNSRDSAKMVHGFTGVTWFQKQSYGASKVLDTPIGRVISGDTANLKEAGARLALDVVVVGDFIDIGQHGILFVLRSDDFDPLVGGLALMGAAATFTGPDKSVAVSLAKSTAKVVGKLKKSYRVLGEAFDNTLKRTAKSGWDNPLKLKDDFLALYDRTLRLTNDADLRKTYDAVLNTPGGLKEFPEHFLKHGKQSFELIESAGKQIGRAPNGFASDKLLSSHFRDHGLETGKAWFGRAFKNKEEYLETAISTTNNPSARKVLYYHQGNPNDPTLGYLLEKGGTVFLVSVSKTGNIKTFHHLDKGWGYVQEGRVFNKLFKIDPF